MKRAKKRKGGLRIETQFTFNQFEEFEGSTKGYRGKREMQKGGGRRGGVNRGRKEKRWNISYGASRILDGTRVFEIIPISDYLNIYYSKFCYSNNTRSRNSFLLADFM